jgi:protein gp37
VRLVHWDPLEGDAPPGGDHSQTKALTLVGVLRDLFDPKVPDPSIKAAFEAIAAQAPQQLLLLSDRPKRMLALGNEGLDFPRNLWVGVRVRCAEEIWRAEDLARCNTRQTWICALPLSGPLPTLPVELHAWVVAGVELGGPVSEVGATTWLEQLRDLCWDRSVPLSLVAVMAGPGPCWQRLAPLELEGNYLDERPAPLRGA